MSSLSGGCDGPDRVAADAVLTYDRGDGEEAATALVRAFSDAAVEVDPSKRERLHAWISVPAIDDLLESAHEDTAISTVIWDHDVVIRPGTVEVYGRTAPFE
jgi:hypothetical protein